MVEKAKNVGATTPKGYTAVKLYNTKTKAAEAYYIPVGQKITVNGKTYDPSKTKNNEFVFTGHTGQKGFNFLGAALRGMDVNGDGRIDKKDTDDNIGKRINRDKKVPNGYFVDMLDPWTYDAYVDKGNGYVSFRKEHIGEREYSVSIDNGENQ